MAVPHSHGSVSTWGSVAPAVTTDRGCAARYGRAVIRTSVIVQIVIAECLRAKMPHPSTQQIVDLLRREPVNGLRLASAAEEFMTSNVDRQHDIEEAELDLVRSRIISAIRS